MTNAELVLQETGIRFTDYPPGLRDLVVGLCECSMGELLMLTEQIEAIDAKKGKLLRDVWERRRDCAELRLVLARLKELKQ